MMTTVLIVCGLIAAAPPPAPSAEDLSAYDAARSTTGRDPEANVRLALWCEAHGLQAERLKHLALAVLADPTNATARGLMGLVAYKGQWKRPEAVAARVKADETLTARLAEYNARRARAHDTADAHWGLALWCEENGLDAEARAHLTAVTRLDPARDAAWKRLGCKKVGGHWLTDAQAAAEKDEAEAQKKADRHWKPLLAKWRFWLDQKGKREEAERELDAIADPRAVPAIWSSFGRKGVRSQTRATEILGRIDSLGATRTLALLATWGESKAVRHAAALTLRRRDPREYVGFLLSLLREPPKYQGGIFLGPDGHYHRSLEVETEDSLWQATAARKIGVPGGLPGYDALGPRLFAGNVPFDPSAQYFPSSPTVMFNPAEVQIAQAMVAHPQHAARILASNGAMGSTAHPVHGHPQALMNTGSSADQFVQNMTRAALNWDARAAWALNNRPPIDSRGYWEAVAEITSLDADIRTSNSKIYGALNLVSGQDLPEDREPWVKWWYDVQGYAYTPPPQKEPKLKPVFFLSMPSCFAAGTPVRTLDGPRPIEDIRVGDRVLAQNTRTGALAFQAVTGVHHNPPGQTLRVKVGSDVIVPSVFHRFWKPGEGWIMARDLKPGDSLRTLEGVATIGSVESGEERPVFNLDVAGDHDFFAGSAAALVHDNMLPDTRLVPFDAAPALAAAGSSGTPNAR